MTEPRPDPEADMERDQRRLRNLPKEPPFVGTVFVELTVSVEVYFDDEDGRPEWQAKIMADDWATDLIECAVKEYKERHTESRDHPECRCELGDVLQTNIEVERDKG